MVGDPPVLLLDEPTSGMDPDARIQLWSVLQSEREKGKCVIITTHRFLKNQLSLINLNKNF